MKLQLLTCGLVFGQKVKPTFSPEQSIKRYTSIRNQYEGLFSITFRPSQPGESLYIETEAGASA